MHKSSSKYVWINQSINTNVLSLDTSSYNAVDPPDHEKLISKTGSTTITSAPTPGWYGNNMFDRRPNVVLY